MRERRRIEGDGDGVAYGTRKEERDGLIWRRRRRRGGGREKR